VDTLLAAAEAPGWWGWVRRGALSGLGKTRSTRAFEALLAHVQIGADLSQVRISGMMALADCAQWMPQAQRDQALEALQDVSRDPDEKLRMATGRALAALGEPGGAAILGRLARGLADQWAVTIRGHLARLEGRLQAKAPGLQQKTIETLEEKVRKLEARIAAVEAADKAREADGKEKDEAES
jgi:hypothetical protein